MPTPPTVIAEIGCNHRGSLDTAMQMIDVAADFCDVDVVKFQKRSPRTLLSPEEYEAPHPEPRHAYGPSYGAHREYLELPIDDHAELKARAESRGLVYSTSVWDVDAAREVIDLGPRMIKVPSACNLDTALLDLLATQFPGEVHVSFGMTTPDEQDAVVSRFERHGRVGDLVVYACTSDYPAAFEDLCLREITRLRERFGDRVAAVGFSGHHLGIAADVAAMTLGAQWVERHFTLDRTWKGTDHAASLEPDGLRRLRRDLTSVSAALTHKSQPILPAEKPHRDKLKTAELETAELETEVPPAG